MIENFFVTTTKIGENTTNILNLQKSCSPHLHI